MGTLKGNLIFPYYSINALQPLFLNRHSSKAALCLPGSTAYSKALVSEGFSCSGQQPCWQTSTSTWKPETPTMRTWLFTALNLTGPGSKQNLNDLATAWQGHSRSRACSGGVRSDWNCLHTGQFHTKSTLGAGDDEITGSTHIFLCCFQFTV